MKRKNKQLALAAAAIGLAVTMTSAFADYITGTGYDGLKDATKSTFAGLADGVDNFTAEMYAAIKVDGVTVDETNAVNKVDIANKATEQLDITTNRGITSEYYSYADSEKRISKNVDGYVVHTYSGFYDYEVFSNPFEEDIVEDIEKIVDALVGSLKDLISVDELDGKKLYTGTLNQAQVPALVNALTSFAMKQETANEHSREFSGLPEMKSDIYINEVYGKALENKDGIIESLVLSGSLSGKDSDGTEHLISAEMTISIVAINETIVSEPDLSGEEVTYYEDVYTEENKLPAEYVGTYKADIIQSGDAGYIKIGEQTLTIYSVENSTVSGKYSEAYYDGYAPENVLDFEFTADSSDRYEIDLTYTDGGEEKLAVMRAYHIDTNVAPKVQIDLDTTKDAYGGYYNSGKIAELTMVFE